MVITNITVRPKTGPVGVLAPQPPPPTPDTVKHRACGRAAPVELGASDGAGVAAAFGAKSGIAAWSPNDHELAIEAIDRAGKPIGSPHVVEAPARVDSAYGIRALDGHYIVFLSKSDFSTESPVFTLYALLTDADGVPSTSFTQVAIGERSLIDSVSPGAAHGVLVWAGPTPATHIDTGRLISLVIDPRGALAQSFIEFTPQMGYGRVHGLFSFGDHAVALFGANMIVDGEVKLRTNDASYDPHGLAVTPTFTGNAVPVIGFGFGNDAKTLRYGTLGLDGALHFAKVEVAKTTPLHEPFEDRVSWGTITDSDGVQVFGSIDDRGGDAGTVKLPAELADAGLSTEVVWSGEQILIFLVHHGKVEVAPLPCT